MNRRSFLAAIAALPACAPLSPRGNDAITLHIDAQGAEALLAALERRSITDADIDRLLTIHGVAAMVDNTTKYLPDDTRAVFREALKEFAANGKASRGHFALTHASQHAADARKVVAELRHVDLDRDVVGPVRRYQPASGPLAVTAYCVVGGASDGFVMDGEREPAFYMAIDRAGGDVEGVEYNMTHELYHVAQRAARARVPGLSARIFDEATAPLPIRFLTTVLEEGTATYVGGTERFRGDGPYIRMWREGHEKNQPVGKVAANFALFDELLAALRQRKIAWAPMYEKGFAGVGGPMYYVGFEMTAVLDRRHGPARIGEYFSEHPAAFYREYILLYREQPHAVRGRFSLETERYLLSLG